jgi:serpin B
MKRAVILLPLLLLLLIHPQAATARPAKGVAGVVKSNTAFALDLYARLRSPKKNLFFSPFSISTALAMTYAGARGKTAEQMAKVLHFPKEALHRAFSELLRATERAGSGNTLAVANALWGQRGFRFLKPYLQLVRTSYRGALEQVDFAKATEQARQTINRWVERRTQKRIKNLIPKGILTPLTRLVLTNAIYFKGTWQVQFAKAKTKKQPFTLEGGKRVEVPLMHHPKGRWKYAAGKDHQLLELPYKGEKLAMVVLLPRKPDGLEQLERQLSPAWLEKRLRALKKQKVDLYLPRFKLETAFRLSKQLKAMGMPLAFSDAADFSGMSTQDDLLIQAVLHKAFVDVNEEGTEAAAATAVAVRVRGIAAPPPVFRADHPFLCLIRDRATDSILFMARVADPRG